MTARTIDYQSLISDRAGSIDVSGIRRVFELGAKLRDPINLSIGQPDFAVPDEIKQATIRAIENDRNGYTLTQGAPDLLRAISGHLKDDIGWDVPAGLGGDGDEHALIITAGTSGALLLAFMAMLDPGDEAIIGDPYFVIYPALAKMVGATAVYCDTYPDFRMTAERVEPLLTERTKLVLINSPGNPSGVVLTNSEMRELAELCESRGVVLVSDEIYDAFTYTDAREVLPGSRAAPLQVERAFVPADRTAGHGGPAPQLRFESTRSNGAGDGRCPSPARFSENVLLVRGFGKSYGCTGWRMGFVAGPRPIVAQMAKLQQYTFVCAPSMAQAGLATAFDVDLSEHVATYQRRRDKVEKAFAGVAEVVHPGGAFYAFVKVPPHLNMTATQFAEEAVERRVLVIPGSVFSRRDTHIRISYATPDEKLTEGLGILRAMMERS